MDRLTATRVFVTVVEQGSLTQAAERLDMSTAMVSRYLAAMEGWLGTRLRHGSNPPAFPRLVCTWKSCRASARVQQQPGTLGAGFLRAWQGDPALDLASTGPESSPVG